MKKATSSPDKSHGLGLLALISTVITSSIVGGFLPSPQIWRLQRHLVPR
ncbi:Arginine/ornithine antiporter ArcD [Levilactobacillus brevis]|nr:Arginine/ornithine antiporter ArcD [Levilactobacillus brevis]